MTKHHGVRWMTNQPSHQYYTAMAEPSWQETIRVRLVERNGKQSAFASIIEQCMFLFRPHQTRNSRVADRRLAQQTKLLKERNASLLKAVGSVRANPSSSTVYIPGTTGPGEEYVRRLLIIMINQFTTLTAIPCAQHI